MFQLEAVCSQSNDDKTDLVLASQLVWVPQGNQDERFPGRHNFAFLLVLRLISLVTVTEGISIVDPDIVIAKLKAGNCVIELDHHSRVYAICCRQTPHV